MPGTPSQVGQELLISLPVATNTYKWTVDFYNASVDPAYRVPDAAVMFRDGAAFLFTVREEQTPVEALRPDSLVADSVGPVSTEAADSAGGAG